MKTVTVWLRPTRASPACKYSYDPAKGSLNVGRKLLSDCRVWMTYFEKHIVVAEPGTDTCPFCSKDVNVAPVRELPAIKPRRPRPLMHLRYDA